MHSCHYFYCGEESFWAVVCVDFGDDFVPYVMLLSLMYSLLMFCLSVCKSWCLCTFVPCKLMMLISFLCMRCVFWM